MAKHCDKCNRPYPDELTSCPNCAEATAGHPAEEGEPSMVRVEPAEKKPVPRVLHGSESEIDIGDVASAPIAQTRHSESAIDLGERGKATHHAPQPAGSEADITLGTPPPLRVPDTNSGVAINGPNSPSSNSGVQWASLVEDVTQPGEISGVRVDSPSDLDLLGKAAKEPDSGSFSDVNAPAASDVSGVMVGSGSDVEALAAGDSASQIASRSDVEAKPPRKEGTSEPDVVLPGDSGSGIKVKSETADVHAETSEVNLGELRRKSQQLPSDLNLASDVLESGTSGVNLDAVPPSDSGASADAVVELAEDAGASSVRLGEDSGSAGSQEPSGLDLTMLSGGESGEGSSILPERPRRPGSSVAKPADRRKRPPTDDADQAGEGDSAVNLGEAEPPPEEEAPQPAAGTSEWETAPGVRLSDEIPSVEDEPTREAPPPPAAVAQTKKTAPMPRPISPLAPQAWPKVLAGSAVGLLLGVLATAGMMALRDKPKETVAGAVTPPTTNLVDAGIQDLIAKVGGKEPADVAKALDQMGEEKKVADQKVADLTTQKDEAARKAADLENQAKLAESKAAELAAQLKAAEKKAADAAGRGSDDKAMAKLTDELKTAQKNATDLAAAVKQAKENEKTAQKLVEEERLASKEAKDKATEALNNLESVKKDMERAKAAADKEIERLKALAKNADSKQPELMKQIAELTTAKKNADAALEGIIKKLKNAKYLPADASSNEIPKAVEQALVAAKTADPAGKLANAQAEVARYQELLNQRWTPQVMLDVWLTALRQNSASKDLAHLALVDANRVSRDKEASNEARAKAACVQGLALRQQNRLDEAKAALTQALRDAPAKGEWQAIAREALQDINTPAALRPISTDAQAQADPNPLQAEWHFSAGVNSYWSGSYARAEEQFQSAIRSDSQDARYHYYLGLARWAQGKRDEARTAFEHGAALERQDRPARAAINALLERVQGSLRQEVDQFRK